MLRTALRALATASAAILAAGVCATTASAAASAAAFDPAVPAAATPCDTDQYLGLMQACQAWSTSKGANTVIEVVGSDATTAAAAKAAHDLAPGATVRTAADLGSVAGSGIAILDVADSAVDLADPKIAALQALGVTIVAAAGDAGVALPQHPANVAEVSAVDAFGQLVPTSDSGPQIALAGYGPDTATASGYVAAAAALIRSAHPTWTARQLVAQLASTAHPITSDSSHNDQSGYGVIHPLLAVTEDGPPDPAKLPGFDALFPAAAGQPGSQASATAPQVYAGGSPGGAGAAGSGPSAHVTIVGTLPGAKKNGTSPLLPAGVALLVVAAALLVVRSRRRSAEPASAPVTPPDEWQPPQGPRHSGYGTPSE